MEGKCVSIMVSKCNMFTLLVARPCRSLSRMWRGCSPPGYLHALDPTASKIGVRRHRPSPRKASSLSPHMHVPVSANESWVQTVHQSLVFHVPLVWTQGCCRQVLVLGGFLKPSCSPGHQFLQEISSLRGLAGSSMLFLY